MPHSLSSVYVHLVFSTKSRFPFLEDESLRKEMHAVLGRVSKDLDCKPIIIGGSEDHVHLLCLLSRTISISEWVKEEKRMSSIWIKKREPKCSTFAWQVGYGAFSVSKAAVGSVSKYIAGQAEHHRGVRFEDEYIALLRKHNLEWDERYIWK